MASTQGTFFILLFWMIAEDSLGGLKGVNDAMLNNPLAIFSGVVKLYDDGDEEIADVFRRRRELEQSD